MNSVVHRRTIQRPQTRFSSSRELKVLYSLWYSTWMSHSFHDGRGNALYHLVRGTSSQKVRRRGCSLNIFAWCIGSGGINSWNGGVEKIEIVLHLKLALAGNPRQHRTSKRHLKPEKYFQHPPREERRKFLTTPAVAAFPTRPKRKSRKTSNTRNTERRKDSDTSSKKVRKSFPTPSWQERRKRKSRKPLTKQKVGQTEKLQTLNLPLNRK